MIPHFFYKRQKNNEKKSVIVSIWLGLLDFESVEVKNV